MLAFVNGDRQDQVDYVQSMTGLGIFFISIVVLWMLTLWLAKCGGRDRMGCAAGYGFHDKDSDLEEDVAERRQRKQQRSGGNNNAGNNRKNKSDTLFKGDGEEVSIGAAYTGGESVALDAGGDDDDDRGGRGGHSFLSFLGGGGGRNSSGHTQDTAISRRREQSATVAMKNTIDKNGDFQYDSDGSPLEEMDAISHYVEPDAPFQPPKSSRSAATSLRSLPKKSATFNTSSTSVTSKYVEQCNRTPCCSFDPAQVQRRKVRTRLAFGFFVVVSLTCSALLMPLMYSPLESASTTTGDAVEEGQAILSEVDASLQVMEEVAVSAQRLFESGDLPLQYELICPQVSSSAFAASFGFNPEEVIVTIEQEYQSYISQASELLDAAQGAIDTVTAVLASVDNTVQSTESHLWLIPFVMCFTMVVTLAFAGLMAGVIYREQSVDLKTDAPKVENCFGWTFLPLMVVVVIISWTLVIAFCFGAVVTTDTCIGPTTGTPEDTVLAVLDYQAQAQGLDAATLERLSVYVDGCRGGDPLEELVVLQGLLRESLAFVDERVAVAEGLGTGLMETACGEGNLVGPFFSNLRVLQGHLDDVDVAITDAYDALECPRINTLYVRVMHDALCTDFATANANGFLLFLFAGLSGLVLITLRASWRTAE